jgi:hypothetical protein
MGLPLQAKEGEEETNSSSQRWRVDSNKIMANALGREVPGWFLSKSEKFPVISSHAHVICVEPVKPRMDLSQFDSTVVALQRTRHKTLLPTMVKDLPNVVQRANGMSSYWARLPSIPLNNSSANNTQHQHREHEPIAFPFESSASIGGLYDVALDISHLVHDDEQAFLFIIFEYGS